MARINQRRNHNTSRVLYPIAWLKKFYRWLINFAKKNRRFTALLLITICLILFIIFGTLTPSLQAFEGNLNLNSLTFTSKIDQPFLKNANSINQIYLKNTLPLKLTGKFNSDDNPKIASLNTITLQPLKDQESWWQIDSQSDGTLEIKELKLTAETTVKNLEYDTFNKRLSIDKIVPKKEQVSVTINASSSDSFNVTFPGYEISKFPDVTYFTWQPDNEITSDIAKEAQLQLQFKEKPDNSIFWGKLEVQNVQLFSKPIINQQNLADYYQESAVGGGVVRLAYQNYTIEEGQFLTFTPEDSITSLLRLKLANESTSTLKTSDNQNLQINEAFQGLKVDISGKTKKIEIGLNDKLPIVKLQASLLEGFMPRDAVIALITLLTTLVPILLGWLWEIMTDENTTEE